MLANPKFVKIQKHCALFLFLTVIGSVFLILHLVNKHDLYPTKVPDDDLVYEPQNNFPHIDEILDEKFESCLLLSSSSNSNRKATKNIYTILKYYTQLVLSCLETKIVLLEPSLLYCLLSPSYKDLLLKRKLSLETLANPYRTLNVGINAETASEIEKDADSIKLQGISVEIIKEPIPRWMLLKNPSATTKQFISHIFFEISDVVIHFVVFYNRSSFIWHDALRTTPIKIQRGALHFAKFAAAYESFDYMSLGFKNATLSEIYIPSNPHHFLFQMTSSRFLECNEKVVSAFAKMQQSKGSSNVVGHGRLSAMQFENRALLSLRGLKSALDHRLMAFFIWSGTLLGWYRQCDIIPYTSDMDYGAWGWQVDNVTELLDYFENKDQDLQLRQRMGLVEKGLEFNLNFHGLRVDLFFLYHQSNGTWYAGHRPSKGYFFKYHHPDFTLCSAELLGEKVLVPCDTEKVLVTEYGPKWYEPVTHWNYETSIFNRGPNIYWEEEMLKKVYPVIV